ncbi:saxiphilin-like [Tubulanus polymorphus]|uniref:saxiphilin-like n=1 Tax=Tubulanus polymorphus TaxID=672921 RepID=UPI003DA44B88
MKFLIILSSVLVSCYGIVCPPNYCDTVKCPTINGCGPRQELVEKSSFCGCCDTCVKSLEIGETCATRLLGASIIGKCYGNTKCHPEKGVCAYKCLDERAEMLKLAQQNMLGVSVPNCEEDGSYSRMRCRGSVCTCLRKDGTETNHRMNAWETEGATCRCARDQAEFLRTGMVGLSFDCADNGNYNPVQCRGSACFCADEFGKQIEGTDSVSIGRKDEMNC